MTKLKIPGININCKEKDYIKEIFDFSKIEETRDSPSLNPYIGKRVGLIQTGVGKATLLGFATISGVTKYESYDSFRDDYEYHRVPKGSKYDFKTIKYGYWLTDVKSCEPKIVSSRGNVAREVA